MGKRFLIKAGTRTRVLWVFSSSIPGTPRFTARPVTGETLSGTVEVARRRWFDWQTETHDLHSRNVFEKGIADADFSIHVTPEQDCEIVFQTRHMRAEIYFATIAALLILGAIAAITTLSFAPPASPAG